MAAPGDEPTNTVPVVNTQRFPMDGITMQIACELHVRVRNITALVAYESALPVIPGGTIHGMPVPQGYSIIAVEQIVEAGGKNENLELDFVGGDGEQKLGEALHGCILWRKTDINLFGNTHTATPVDPPSLPGPNNYDVVVLRLRHHERPHHRLRQGPGVLRLLQHQPNEKK
ncbi:transposon protein, putative, CACTA, En/Spm sub-class [Panicum miliaceum]|uniref:Transposon protein, putative, CACTA, En/Spm sub-class n=1 Tax=Panicum miliaceum TaxID=4540 RepID=A0A3L6RPF9_PANMI|nr:transposon protein, putative, CACTA, En/Spm sub-class [Panicum miliaceum]